MRNLEIREMVFKDDYVIVVNSKEESDSFVQRFQAEKLHWDEGCGESAYLYRDQYPIYLSLGMCGMQGIYTPDWIRGTPNGDGYGYFKFANWNDLKDIMVPDDFDAKAEYEEDGDILYRFRDTEFYPKWWKEGRTANNNWKLESLMSLEEEDGEEDSSDEVEEESDDELDSEVEEEEV